MGRPAASIVSADSVLHAAQRKIPLRTRSGEGGAPARLRGSGPAGYLLLRSRDRQAPTASSDSDAGSGIGGKRRPAESAG